MKADTEKTNILIVDDRIENIISLEALLQRDDINLITTTSPNDALRLCWQHDISIALVDVQMPEMDGFELVEILKSNPRTQEIVVVFVTAISKETKYAVKGLSTGAVDYLYKPLDPLITVAKVDSFITLVQNQREIKKKNIQLENYQKELIVAKDTAERAKLIKENFLANMSHEIRTPINGIMGISQLLHQTELNQEQLGMVDLLSSSAQSLLGIVNDILDISKIDAGKFKIVKTETDIHKLIQSVIDLTKFKTDEKSIQIEAIIDQKVPQIILADSLRLNQILMNLVSNAVKFTNEGKVVVQLKELQRKDSKTQLQIDVIDTGIGIAEDAIDKVFDSFEQAEDTTSQKFGGTGLGLSIVKKLVELKGGTISLESEINKGSTFTFTNWYEIIDKPAHTTDKKVLQSKLSKFENLSVLVAEDNTINQFVIARILKNWNVAVEIVEDGVAVLEKLKESHFVLMDTHMPVMNGLEATRRIRAEFSEPEKSIPIISLSAAVMEEEQQVAKEAGANNVLSKPFEPVVLHAMITELLVNK